MPATRALLALAVIVIAACGDSGFEPSGGGAGDTGGNGSGLEGGSPPVPTCEDPGDLHDGEGTYYDADGSGNCSFDATPGDPLVAAMNHTDYAASAVCGACVTIASESGAEITVRIVDQCPECPAGDIDMHPDAFGMLADPSLGRIPISWHYSPCGVAGPIVYHFKEGSNPFWTAVQIRNHAVPILSVEGKDASGSYVPMPRADYNFFIADGGLGEGPHSFRVTSTSGEVLEDSGIPFVEAGDSPGAAQFAPCPD